MLCLICRAINSSKISCQAILKTSGFFIFKFEESNWIWFLLFQGKFLTLLSKSKRGRRAIWIFWRLEQKCLKPSKYFFPVESIWFVGTLTGIFANTNNNARWLQRAIYNESVSSEKRACKRWASQKIFSSKLIMFKLMYLHSLQSLANKYPPLKYFDPKVVY